MSSPLLALFVRSLREDSRQKLIYAARAGLVAVVAVFMILSVIVSGWRGAPGLNFFTAIVHIQTVFITLAGLSYFASAITEEKEERMLGLLRMTELDPLSILLGKSTSRLCSALLLLAAQFPFTLLAVTLGGVTARQIVASYLALGAYTFFLCNLALLASVTSRRTGHAALKLGLALALLWVAPTLFLPLDGLLPGPWIALSEGFEIASTSFRLQEILGSGFDGALIGPQFLGNAGAGLACFCVAWLVFEHCATRDADGDASVTVGRWSWRRHFPPDRVWPRALVWKDAYFVHGGRAVAASKFVGYGLLLGAHVIYHALLLGPFTAERLASSCLRAAGIAAIALALELGVAASRIFRVEVRDKTLSSLALLPLSFRDLHHAKVQSCHHAALPAALSTGLCLTIAFVAGLRSGSPGFFFLFPMSVLGLLWIAAELHLFFNLVAWLSLKFSRGALPLAVLFLGAGHLVAGLAGAITFGIAIFALPFIALIISGVFQDRVVRRLEELTTED